MDNNNQYNTDQYFATLPEDDIGPALKTRIDNYYQFIQNYGVYDLWSNSYSKYYASSVNAGSLMQSGEQGEYTIYRENQFRNFLQYILTMTTKEPPAFDCIATNSDLKSVIQAQLGVGLLEYYLKEKDLSSYLKQAAEYCLLMGEGFLEATWNATSGEKLPDANPDKQVPTDSPPYTQSLKYKGDLEFNVYNPLDVIRDFYGHSAKDANNWIILRSFQNKWDLCAKYPEKREEIISQSLEMNSWLRFDNNAAAKYDINNCDLIPVYKFYHRPSESLPEGRMTHFISDECILLDTTLPYRELPVYRLAGSEYIGTIFGYSVAFDILNCQEALDDLNSIIMTNNLTFGVQNIAMPDGSNITPSSVVKGLNLISFDPKLGPPQALNFTQTAAETFNYRETVIESMETLSGVNSVTRGQPEASLKSGTALALIESRALEFNSGFQETYMKCAENVGTSIINLLKTFATVERNALILGLDKRAYTKYFTSDDLNQINRVHVVPANPLSKTIAGRLQIAENLIQNQMITTAKEYLDVMTSGKLDPLIQHEQAELNLIRAENQDLSNGEEVIAILTDNHSLHIPEHMTVLASPDARRDPTILRNTLAHIQEHINLYKTADPIILQLTKQEPPQAGQAQPQVEGATSGVVSNQNPTLKKAGEVQPPNGPKPPEPLVADQEINEDAYIQ